MKWVADILDFIKNYANENLLTNPQAEATSSVIQKVEEEIERTAGFQPNPKIRKAVELHAMRRSEIEFAKGAIRFGTNPRNSLLTFFARGPTKQSMLK